MGAATRPTIPRILGIGWWWLLVPCFLEWVLRAGLHVPFWIPPFEAWWILGQLVWLKIVEPRSRALYWALLSCGLWEFLINFREGKNDSLTVALTVVFFAAVFMFLHVFRNELEHHFNVTDPIGLDLSGWGRLLRMFVLNAFYFQFYFHKLYRKQQKICGSLTPTGA